MYYAFLLKKNGNTGGLKLPPAGSDYGLRPSQGQSQLLTTRVPPYQAFKTYIHIFLHSASTIYNKSILLLPGTRKKDAFWRPLGIKKGSLSNVGVFTLRVFFGTNHSYGWCHSFCSKVEYVL